MYATFLVKTHVAVSTSSFVAFHACPACRSFFVTLAVASVMMVMMGASSPPAVPSIALNLADQINPVAASIGGAGEACRFAFGRPNLLRYDRAGYHAYIHACRQVEAFFDRTTEWTIWQRAEFQYGSGRFSMWRRLIHLLSS